VTRNYLAQVFNDMRLQHGNELLDMNIENHGLHSQSIWSTE